jgi:hypothetical protein
MSGAPRRRRVRNQAALDRATQLQRCAEGLTAVVAPHAAVQPTRVVSTARAPQRVWSVLEGTGGMGVAVNVSRLFASETALQQLITRLRSAQGVVQYCAKYGTAPPLHNLHFVEQDQVPAEWRTVEVPTSHGGVWFAASPAFEDVAPDGGTLLSAWQNRTVSSPVVAVLEGEFQLYAGATVMARPAWFEFGAWNVRLFIEQGGTGRMSLRGEQQGDGDVGQGSVPGVVVDLGEIEIDLQTVLALRAGSSIELESETPLRGYVRCGTTQLALAEIEVGAQAIVLNIVEVF